MLLQTTGSLLKAARKSKKLNLKEAGELSGLPYSQISNIENGLYNVNLQTIQKLAAVYGLEPVVKFKKLKNVKNS